MNPSGTFYEGQNSIDPFYMKGDVFQRDPRYYQQFATNRRSRTPNRTTNPYNSVPNPTYPQPQSSNYYGSSQPTSVIPPPTYTPPPPTQSRYDDPEQVRRLMAENQLLANQLRNLTHGGYGSQFGNGDVVTKKNYYTANRPELNQIREQQAQMQKLQNIIRVNNDKLVRYSKASNELQLRMGNIQSIDRQIYKQLRTATTRDRELLDRAAQAMSRGDTRQNITRILEQISLQ